MQPPHYIALGGSGFVSKRLLFLNDKYIDFDVKIAHRLNPSFPAISTDNIIAGFILDTKKEPVISKLP